MIGKLTIESIPLHEPIIMITISVLMSFILIFIILITYLNKWQYLWKEWITSVDHKKIGIMYIIISFLMFLRGFIDAIMMRIQQFLVSQGHTGFLSPDHYNQVFTVHGVIMIFFVAMPFLIGLMNFIIPLQIGSRDLAFPFINNLSFWLTAVSIALVNISLGVGEFAKTGWLAYPPLSNIQYSPDVGVDYWIWSLQLSGIGTILTGINFVVTILKMRAPGMSFFKMPVFSWTALCSNILIIFSFPVLAITLMLLTLDRYFNFHFFTENLGGNAMMYINLIWIWGHPEVYILILPAFGIFSEIVSTFSKKYLFGYKSLVWATIVITILSFLVWLHHFFTMGASAKVNSFFGIMTMIIAIPTGVKIFNWIFTLYQGHIKINTAILWTIGFLITFSIGGMSGVLLSIPSVDFVLHNSLFLVAHFHNVIIGGVIFGIFAALNYWFPKIFGFTLNEKWGKRSFFFWIIGFFLAFMPLYGLGMMGMTRRLGHNIDYKFHFLLKIATLGVILIGIGIICQLLQLLISYLNKKNNLDTNGDPWNGRTLEWSISSPPPHYNFAIIPTVKFLDDFWRKKENNHFFEKNRYSYYENIYMPKNTSFGFIISIFSLILSFSLIWYIWWLAIVSFLFIILLVIVKSIKNKEYEYIDAEEIKKIENSNNF